MNTRTASLFLEPSRCCLQISTMTGPNLANTVYLHVVQDVINNVRADFESEGVEEGVLEKLQKVNDVKGRCMRPCVNMDVLFDAAFTALLQ